MVNLRFGDIPKSDFGDFNHLKAVSIIAVKGALLAGKEGYVLLVYSDPTQAVNCILLAAK